MPAVPQPAIHVTVERPSGGPGWFWALFIFVVVGICLVAGAILLNALRKPVGTLDPVAVQQTISTGFQVQFGGTPTSVVCPAGQPLRAGWIFDCTIDVVPIPLIVRVTENDDRGHIFWQVTSQPAGFPPGG